MKRPLTAEKTELLLAFVRGYIPFAEDGYIPFAEDGYIPFAGEMIGPTYGLYMGGDPRNFSPEQRERHRRMCEARGAASGASRRIRL